MSQKDLCLYKGADLSYPYTLSLFTVLWLVLLSLLAPFGVCALWVVSLENSCSETQLRDPDSQHWYCQCWLPWVRMGEVIQCLWISLHLGMEREFVGSPVWVQYRLTFQFTHTTPPRDSNFDLRCDWANLWLSGDFSLEISCSACSYTMVCVLLTGMAWPQWAVDKCYWLSWWHTCY